MAVDIGFLSHDDVEEILQEQAESGYRFGATAVRLEKLTEDQVACLLAKQKHDPSGVARALVQQVPQQEVLARAVCTG